MGFPKTLGACIDALYKLRAQRLEIEKRAGEVKARETELEAHLIERCGKSELDGARGKVAVVAVSQSSVPTVKDWDAFYAHVHRTKSFDLLQKRVSTSAYRERMDAHEAVPGVESFVVTKLSLRKR